MAIKHFSIVHLTTRIRLGNENVLLLLMVKIKYMKNSKRLRRLEDTFIWNQCILKKNDQITYTQVTRTITIIQKRKVKFGNTPINIKEQKPLTLSRYSLFIYADPITFRIIIHVSYFLLLNSYVMLTSKKKEETRRMCTYRQLRCREGRARANIQFMQSFPLTALKKVFKLKHALPLSCVLRRWIKWLSNAEWIHRFLNPGCPHRDYK